MVSDVAVNSVGRVQQKEVNGYLDRAEEKKKEGRKRRNTGKREREMVGGKGGEGGRGREGKR